MAKASLEFVYGLNPAFEVLRAGRRKVYGAWLNQASRDKPRIKKLVTLLKKHGVEVEWAEKGRLIQLSTSRDKKCVCCHHKTCQMVCKILGCSMPAMKEQLVAMRQLLVGTFS